MSDLLAEQGGVHARLRSGHTRVYGADADTYSLTVRVRGVADARVHHVAGGGTTLSVRRQWPLRRRAPHCREPCKDAICSVAFQRLS